MAIALVAQFTASLKLSTAVFNIPLLPDIVLIKAPQALCNFPTDPARLSLLIWACSYAVFVFVMPVRSCSNASRSCRMAMAAVTDSLPNILVSSVASIFFADKFSSARDKPTTDGRSCLSAEDSNVRNMFLRLVPALPASVIRGAIASIAATRSLNLIPTEEAAPPAFSIALLRYGMSAEPCWDAAARILMYSAACTLDCPI